MTAACRLDGQPATQSRRTRIPSSIGSSDPIPDAGEGYPKFDSAGGSDQEERIDRVHQEASPFGPDLPPAPT